MACNYDDNPLLAAAAAERQARMVKAYRAGQTLQAIGDEYGITRERVRQILAKAGLRRADGGMAVASVPRKAARAACVMEARRANWEARSQAHYGCSFAEFIEANGGKRRHPGSLAQLYQRQRCSAGHRGIEWRITFPEWVSVWRASGHLDDRGRGGDRYVMARKGDTGPYAVGNVYITTLRENSRDWQMHRLGRTPSYAKAA